jgi:hypothetical protein
MRHSGKAIMSWSWIGVNKRVMLVGEFKMAKKKNVLVTKDKQAKKKVPAAKKKSTTCSGVCEYEWDTVNRTWIDLKNSNCIDGCTCPKVTDLDPPDSPDQPAIGFAACVPTGSFRKSKKKRVIPSPNATYVL